MTTGGHVTVVPPRGGKQFRIGADRFRRKSGAPGHPESFSVIEYEGAPGVPGPPPHRHRSFEESWYVLDGRIAFYEGSRRREVGPGAYVLVPRGVPHTFQVLGTTPARWVGIFAPGRYGKLVEELGRLIPGDGPPDLAAVAALFARYDTELVDPTASRGRGGVR